MTNPNPSYLSPSDGRSFNVGPFAFRFKAGRDTASSYTFAEVTVPSGAQNGPHHHPCEETMYVVAGELEYFDATGERRTLGAGAAVHVPSNAVHGYRNATATPARLLVVAPVAQEDVFADLSAAGGDRSRVAAAMARHGVIAAVLLVMLALVGCKREPAPPTDPVKRGLVLVQAGSCNDCHTPMSFDAKLGMPVPQMDRMLSGHPATAPDPTTTLAKDDQAVIGPTFTSFGLPFGVAYAANLTPDKDTGLGQWTREMFIGAMRTGRHMGMQGRPILPPMPWANLAQLSDDDLGAIWAYLRTIPPISNRVPEPKVPPPVYEELKKQYSAMLGSK